MEVALWLNILKIHHNNVIKSVILCIAWPSKHIQAIICIGDLPLQLIFKWKYRTFLKEQLNSSCRIKEALCYWDHRWYGLSNLPPKKWECPLLLLDGMEAQVQAYIRNAKDCGCPVTSSVVIATASGVVKKMKRILLEDKRGPLSINKSWAKSFLCRVGFVKRKVTTTFKVTPENFDSLKNTFLEQIKTTIEFENIPLDLVFNWD